MTKLFSTGALGKGIGIKPISHVIHSPIDGEVLTVFSYQTRDWSSQ